MPFVLLLIGLMRISTLQAEVSIFIDRPGDSEACLAPGSLFLVSGRIFAFDAYADEYATVTKVEIYRGTEKLGEAGLDNPDGYGNWQFLWSPVQAGTNYLQAVGYSRLGVGTASVTVVFTITNNSPPLAMDVRSQVSLNTTGQVIAAVFTDKDYDQLWSVSVVDPPSHGTLSIGPSGKTTLTYAPYPDFFGIDSFTYRVNDSVTNSNRATGRILVCRPDHPEGALVIVMVNSNLFVDALSNEIQRLESDLEAENYTAEIKLWPSSGTFATNVWSFLRDHYTNPTPFFVGAILIGNIPKPMAGGVYNELIYWNMNEFQTVSSRVNRRHIWVSRICVEDFTAGSEVTLIRRALDANHAYRRGQSRLPFTAYRYKNPEWWNDRQFLTSVWPVVEQRGQTVTNLHFLPDRADLGNVAGADSLVKGGDLFEEESHGNGTGYMSSYGWVSKNTVQRNLVQVRVCLLGSCASGTSGGIANEHLFSRGGGCVLAIGATEDNFIREGVISDDASFLTLLQQGRSWGDALVENFTLGQWANSALYGDLSFRPLALGESNQMPAVTQLGVSSLTVGVGQPVIFTVACTDPEGSVSNIEWFLQGFSGGRAPPTFSGLDTQVSYAYSAVGVYTARVEIIDPYQARSWREALVTVTPMQTCTLTVVQSGNGSSSLGCASPATCVLPQGATTQIVFEAADWHRIVSLSSNSIAIEAAVGTRVYTHAFVNVTADISNEVSFALATPDQTGYSNVPTAWLTNWAEIAIRADPRFTLYEKYLIGLDPTTANTFSFAIELFTVNGSNVIIGIKRLYTGGLAPDGMQGRLVLQVADRLDTPFTNVPGAEATGPTVFDETGRTTFTNLIIAGTNQFIRGVIH
jgi:hypothetical protein